MKKKEKSDHIKRWTSIYLPNAFTKSINIKLTPQQDEDISCETKLPTCPHKNHQTLSRDCVLLLDRFLSCSWWPQKNHIKPAQSINIAKLSDSENQRMCHFTIVQITGVQRSSSSSNAYAKSIGNQIQH